MQFRIAWCKMGSFKLGECLQYLVPNSSRFTHRHTSSFVLSRLIHMVLRYIAPHSPQTVLSDSAYLLVYFLDQTLSSGKKPFFCYCALQSLTGLPENISWDNSWVIVSNVILFDLTSIFLHLLFEEICSIGFCSSTSPAYFSFCSIFRMVVFDHVGFPVGDGMWSASRDFAICSGVSPLRNAKKSVKQW